MYRFRYNPEALAPIIASTRVTSIPRSKPGFSKAIVPNSERDHGHISSFEKRSLRSRTTAELAQVPRLVRSPLRTLHTAGSSSLFAACIDRRRHQQRLPPARFKNGTVRSTLKAPSANPSPAANRAFNRSQFAQITIPNRVIHADRCFKRSQAWPNRPQNPILRSKSPLR